MPFVSFFQIPSPTSIKTPIGRQLVPPYMNVTSSLLGPKFCLSVRNSISWLFRWTCQTEGISVRPSVGSSVRRSVGLSVRRSVGRTAVFCLNFSFFRFCATSLASVDHRSPEPNSFRFFGFLFRRFFFFGSQSFSCHSICLSFFILFVRFEILF